MALNDDRPERVALYARVSSEDQAERQTVRGQLDFLRNFCELYGLPVAGEFVDDGWSGAVALGQRPNGRRLLEGAEAGAFETVLVYRLDRLGRSLSALLDAHSALERHGVAIRSASEPFDTSTSIGRFIFQLLGGIAELEKATIAERTRMGRDRVARTGKWTGGRIPLGYDLGEDGRLVVSERMVPELGMTEAQVVRDLFERVAEGSSATGEARRLNAAGVRPFCRYAGKEAVHIAETWTVSRISSTLRNATYKGSAVVRSSSGAVGRPAPALVSRELWERACRQLIENRNLARRGASRAYLLTGLITCEVCGYNMTGKTVVRKGAETRYYCCNPSGSHAGSRQEARSHAKFIRGEPLEAQVWEDCRRFIHDPGEALADAQGQLRARLERAAGLEGQRRALLGLIAAKEAERERVMVLFRRGRLSLEDAEGQLDEVEREAASLRQMADALRSQAELADAFEAHVSEAASMLSRLRTRLDDIEREDDFEARREIVRLLVGGITVRTTGEGRGKTAEIAIRYVFGEPRAVDYRTASHSWHD